MNKLEVGDRVKYVSGRHNSGKDNPLVQTMWECAGTVDHVYSNGTNCTVKWDNGGHNSYDTEDLAFANSKSSSLDPNIAFRIKKRTIHKFADHSSKYSR